MISALEFSSTKAWRDIIMHGANSEYIRSQRRIQNHVVKFQLFAVILFFGLVTAPTAFSQTEEEIMPGDPPPGEYSYVDYTDQWTDNSNPEVPIIVGTGVTETSYDSYGDISVIEGTFTDPNGNSTAGSGHGDLYASVMLGLPYYWDFTNDGDWVFDGIFSRYCSSGPFWVPSPSYYLDGVYYAPCSGYSFQQRRITRRGRRRFVIHSYRKEAHSGEYLPTCDSNCTYHGGFRPFPGKSAPFIECNTVYTFGEGCADVYFCKDRTTPGRCSPLFNDPY